MKTQKYIEVLKKINSEHELKKLLSFLEDDEEINSRNYETIRYLIVKKIYS